MRSIVRKLVTVKGIVQGVGFRPFAYRAALACNLKGLVMNSPEGVILDIEGTGEDIERFIAVLRKDSPSLSTVDEIVVNTAKILGYTEFLIGETDRTGKADTLVSADAAVCQECLKELFNPADRRYHYPFINCTNCGPRFTLTEDIPYDREFTTMKSFPLCQQCSKEYYNQADRRFHAQPNACGDCGPRVTLRDAKGGLIDCQDPLERAAQLLQAQQILAVKGLGGYHLTCNALDEQAVARLRTLKFREDKPFAIMVKDLLQAEAYGLVAGADRDLLSSSASPIVLVPKGRLSLARLLAPGHSFIGMMLPYTPLHHLLFEKVEFPLVMTSGNLRDEPIAYQDEDVFEKLGSIADYFLTHNRPIQHRCDDSVTRVYRDQEVMLRRSRGYAPSPVRLPQAVKPILAVGGEQKNTFCLARGQYAFVSHHIGDLKNIETLQAFDSEIVAYKKLFRTEPELVAHDLHSEYLSTKYALGLPGLEKIAIQHHHAHIASCMAEYGLTGKVLGVALDGTGYGVDGAIWGGEFLYSSLLDFHRYGRLKYIPMPGGGYAVKEPWRMAAGYLYSLFGSSWIEHKGVTFIPGKAFELAQTLTEMMKKGINCPLTSSMGRLFDAVAALIGLRQTVNYEGQAAVELEQIALQSKKINSPYDYVINASALEHVIDADTVIQGVLEDVISRERTDVIAARFHYTIRDMVVHMCLIGRRIFGENRVCLSGGVFQNMFLLDLVHSGLEEHRFEVFIPRLVPVNDGGISLGQAVIANERSTHDCV